MTLGGGQFGVEPFGSGQSGGPAGTSIPGLLLRIGAMDATVYLRVFTYRLIQDLNSRDEADCTLLNHVGYVPQIGESFELSLNGGVLFAGTVQERDVTFISEGRSDYLVIEVKAVDWNELADRHTVAEIYQHMTAGAIVRAIVTTYLAGEGVTIGDVQDGPLVEGIKFAYASAASCFDQLSQQTGYHWTIDAKKALSFFARTTTPAPFTLTSANAVFRKLKSSRTRNQYRNVQYLAGGKGVTDPRTEFFVGDGTRQSFDVQYPVNSVPAIELNNVPQTVGIRGVDEGTQWLWNAGETAIGQNGGSALRSTDRLSVTYQGQWTITYVVQDAAAILERQAVQGGTGRYEQLEQDTSLEGLLNVQDKAMALLRRFASIDDVADFETDVPGLAVGQLLTVNVPELGLVGEFLITHLETTSLLLSTRRFMVTATTGELKGTWQEFVTRLIASDQPITIQDNAPLALAMALSSPVGVSDSVTAVLTNAATGEWGTGEAGTAEFGG